MSWAEARNRTRELRALERRHNHMRQRLVALYFKLRCEDGFDSVLDDIMEIIESDTADPTVLHVVPPPMP